MISENNAKVSFESFTRDLLSPIEKLLGKTPATMVNQETQTVMKENISQVTRKTKSKFVQTEPKVNTSAVQADQIPKSVLTSACIETDIITVKCRGTVTTSEVLPVSRE